MVLYMGFVFKDASVHNYRRCLFSGLPTMGRLMEFCLRWRFYGFLDERYFLVQGGVTLFNRFQVNVKIC